MVEKARSLTPTRDSFDPFITLHREMNRLFDDVWRRIWDALRASAVR